MGDREQDELGEARTGGCMGRRGLAESLGVASQCVEVRRVVSRSE